MEIVPGQSLYKAEIALLFYYNRYVECAQCGRERGVQGARASHLVKYMRVLQLTGRVAFLTQRDLETENLPRVQYSITVTGRGL